MNREWRRCETCEWWVQRCRDSGNCHKHVTVLSEDYDIKRLRVIVSETSPDHWCSEWKSAEPETCGDCEWYSGVKEVPWATCCCTGSKEYDEDVNAPHGACEYFRRKG